MDGSHNSLCPHRSGMPHIYSVDPSTVLNQRIEKGGAIVSDQGGLFKGHGFSGTDSITGSGEPNSALPKQGIFKVDKAEMKDKLYSLVMGATLFCILGIVAFFIVVTWWPFNPAKFYPPIIHTPIVERGELFHYDMVLDKYTEISPRIQRTLVCGKDENIIVLENAVGTSKTGNKRVRSIHVEIPKNAPADKVCQVLTHIEYPYFGGLRNVKYDVWSGYFEVK
jgi:hypothetical protein